MPEITGKRVAMGCANLVTMIGGFGLGIYYGIAKSKGISDPPGKEILLYAPTFFGGVLGYAGSSDITSDSKALEEAKDMSKKFGRKMNPNLPGDLVDRVVDAQKAPSPIAGGVVGAIINAAVTGVGYFIGSHI